MDINQVNGYSLTDLSRINVLLGKNGSGKSTILKSLESNLSTALSKIDGGWGKMRYITPERGGVLIYEGGIDQNIVSTPNWMRDTRNVNQLNNFKQQSFAQYRNLETIVLKEIEKERRSDQDYSFDLYVDTINSLLDNVEIRRSPLIGFKIYKKGTDRELTPQAISSGESEAIAIAIECLVFSKETSQEKENILFIDEPDVHLHPDLQSRLIRLLKKLVEENEKLNILIATHSTAILGELSNYQNARICFMKSGDTDLKFFPINDVYKKILPVFGAHPLSNIFNEAPVLLLEGEDDERIWQQAVRSSKGNLKVYPVSCGSVDKLNKYEEETKEIINSVYDEAKAYSLRDRDEKPEDINDLPPVVRARLSCRAAENLLLSNEVLASVSLSWDELKTGIVSWVSNNPRHQYANTMQAFIDSDFDRKNFDLKDLRMLIAGTIFASNKSWEVLVGIVIGNLRKRDVIDYSLDGSVLSYLGKKTVESLLPS